MAARTLSGARGTEINNGGQLATITVAETLQIYTGKGVLGRLMVTSVGTSMTIDIYDHASTTNNKIVEYVTADGKVNWELNLPVSLGIRVVTGGTPGIAHIVFQSA